MAEDSVDQQLLKWLRGELSEDELSKATSPEDMLKYKQIVEETDRWVPDADPVSFTLDEIPLAVKKGRVKLLNGRLLLSIAASIFIVMAAAVWIFTTSDQVRYATGAGETKEVLLPDGRSKIVLASNSEVSWQKDVWSAGKRRLSLAGKGFLEVEKGSSFVVTTRNGKVEVLGTAFEVSEFADGFQVICYEGKVKATFRNAPPVIVNGGEGYLYYRGRWEAETELPGESPPWLQNESGFINAPLAQVIRTLESEFDLTIITGSINTDRRFTGSFPNHNLNLALKIVFEPLGITYQLKKDRLYLSE